MLKVHSWTTLRSKHLMPTLFLQHPASCVLHTITGTVTLFRVHTGEMRLQDLILNTGSGIFHLHLQHGVFLKNVLWDGLQSFFQMENSGSAGANWVMTV